MGERAGGAFYGRCWLAHPGILGPPREVAFTWLYYDDVLKQKLASYDLMWVMGGNTFNLRYEVKRDLKNTRELLDEGVAYGVMALELS